MYITGEQAGGAQVLNSDGRPKTVVLIMEDLLNLRTLPKAASALPTGPGSRSLDAASLISRPTNSHLLNVIVVGIGLNPPTRAAQVAVALTPPPPPPTSPLEPPLIQVEGITEDMVVTIRKVLAPAPSLFALRVWQHVLSPL